MLETLRDRDLPPLRRMVPWAGEFAGKYLTGAVEVLRATGDARLKAWIKKFVHRLIGFQDTDGCLGPWPSSHKLTNTAPNCSIDGSIDTPLWKHPVGDTWAHYTITLGLLRWYDETRDSKALRASERIADLMCRMYGGGGKPRLVDTGESDKNVAPVHTLGILYRRLTGPRRRFQPRTAARASVRYPRRSPGRQSGHVMR